MAQQMSAVPPAASFVDVPVCCCYCSSHLLSLLLLLPGLLGGWVVGGLWVVTIVILVGALSLLLLQVFVQLAQNCFHFACQRQFSMSPSLSLLLWSFPFPRSVVDFFKLSADDSEIFFPHPPFCSSSLRRVVIDQC